MALRADLKQWAKLGAIARLKEIDAEIASISRAFPDLRGQRSGPPVASSGGRRKRKRFSAAGKRAISNGIRKYWARRKANEATVTAR